MNVAFIKPHCSFPMPLPAYFLGIQGLSWLGGAAALLISKLESLARSLQLVYVSDCVSKCDLDGAARCLPIPAHQL